MSQNPLLDELSTSLPGVTVALPSQGRFYEPGVLAEGTDVNEVEVGTLSMVDELKYRDPFLLASGRAMRDMVRRICPAVLDPDKLCDIDMEAIILAARIASYGEEMEVEVTCSNPATVEELDPDTQEPTGKTFPVCEHQDKYTADLISLMQKYAPLENLDEYDFVLKPWGQKIAFKPMSHEMSLHVTKMMMQRNKEIAEFEGINDDDALFNDGAMDAYVRAMTTTVEMTVDLLVDTIHMVTAASGAVITDKGMIHEWILRLPREKVEEINIAANKLIEHTRSMSKFTYVCPACGHEQDVPLVLDADKLFLSVAEPSGAQKTPSPTSATSAPKVRRRSKTLPSSHTSTTEESPTTP